MNMAVVFGTSELETILAIRSIEGLSQLGVANTSDYENPLVGLTRLVETTGLLTPPGFEAIPTTPLVCDTHKVLVHNDVSAPSAFNPCLTSSPGCTYNCENEAFGEVGPVSHEGLHTFGGNRESSDLHNNDHTVNTVQGYTDLDTAGWTDELLHAWNENSFAEKVPETVDAGAVLDVGLGVLLGDLRDIDGENLRANQEHEKQVSGPYPSGENEDLRLLLRQEVVKNTIEKRRQAALQRRSKNTIKKLTEQIQKQNQQHQKFVHECRKQHYHIFNRIQALETECKELNQHLISFTNVLYSLNKVLELKLSDVADSSTT
ncbi:hypothetical protein NFI96_021957 [Prochilodus magdalenae]|nr:hypothetical protein NFI96_021957 [Prochilodus magdalenae]